MRTRHSAPLLLLLVLVAVAPAKADWKRNATRGFLQTLADLDLWGGTVACGNAGDQETDLFKVRAADTAAAAAAASRPACAPLLNSQRPAMNPLCAAGSLWLGQPRAAGPPAAQPAHAGGLQHESHGGSSDVPAAAAGPAQRQCQRRRLFRPKRLPRAQRWVLGGVCTRRARMSSRSAQGACQTPLVARPPPAVRQPAPTPPLLGSQWCRAVVPPAGLRPKRRPL